MDIFDLEPKSIDFIKGPLGLKIMVIYTEGDLFEIQLQMKVGTFNETLPDELEYAHLLEHLNAQFTSSLNRNQKKIIESIESKGVEWNAFTSSRHTGYYTKGFCDQKMKAPLIKNETIPATEIAKSDAFWQILSTMLESYFRFKMDKSLFFQEVKAVNRELSGHLGGNMMTLDEMHTCVLFPGHPISALLIDRIKNMSLQLEDQYKFQKKIMNFRKTHYHPSRTVLTLAIPNRYAKTFKTFDFDGFMKYMAKGTTFDIVPRTQTPIKKFVIPASIEKLFKKKDEGPSYIRASINSIVSRAEDTTIMMSVRLPQVDYNNIEHKTMLKAVCFILSTGFSSRLMKRIRTQDGLIYSIQVFPELDRVDSNLNLMTITTSVKSKDAWTAVTHIIEECEALGKKEGNWITTEELQIFKNYEERRFQEIALDKTATKWVDHYTTDLLFSEHFDNAGIEKYYDKYTAVKLLNVLSIRTACTDIYKNAEVLVTFNNTVDFFKKLFSSEEFQK